MTPTRREKFSKLFPNQPKFRWKQIESALFQEKNHSWDDVSSLPIPIREKLAEELPWLSLKRVTEVGEADGSVRKVLLEAEDGARIESVLMQNKSGKYSVCVSTQVGCAMGCSFCSTGKLGLKRNLSADEIVDQLRYWSLSQTPISIPEPNGDTERKEIITNIVLMGMGEPMNNYESVREALNSILTNTGIGPTHITVSSAGVLPRLNKILDDKEWPPVCIAISLHSADPIIRKKIMPSSGPNFLPELAEWAEAYLKLFGNRSHYLTFEYIMLDGVNDSAEDAKKLAAYTKPLSRAKINLIAYNDAAGQFKPSSPEKIQAFMNIILAAGVDVTRRQSLGGAIQAACGQLAAGERD
ncbi:MAG: YloN [Candidatus Uhrbacteria bacterium GW2011_GWE2_45_35]|uniref:YloN n=2 Tax=Candidatus Uhriibacteriota TaxID=1752732 RepID=A0A0G1JEV4_9BACT|nr:MAG: YloN [Candidatus Uhrbacteria bacterium GW2011_GWF2_44_350]KKU07024.1 MAG: YloN [Candidatus Uhrbacteria bacterium GW2011_GWE2_45_35]